ncbi:MAG: hypothetical protein K6F95_02435 [Selenomonas sp.]|uniref:hypothetical protein n=1 Tax=Selenomonas sp. TaxID=2053611 RepID=UPI0025F73962|nr:hypothetical protein [Selenomonas sp.]MCR5756749.1 hypothetical protein [Selenomonas sp.]
MSIVKGRIAWLDAAKGLTIALVVSAHCIDGEWEVFFSPIRMPLFFIAADFTLKLPAYYCPSIFLSIMDKSPFPPIGHLTIPEPHKKGNPQAD